MGLCLANIEVWAQDAPKTAEANNPEKIMTAKELKAAFVANLIAQWDATMATASDRMRRVQTKPRPEGAWDAHMKSVVTGKINVLRNP